MKDKPSRLDLYLNQSKGKSYVNTEEENELVSKFVDLYTMAKNARNSCEHASPENISKWRKAYLGTLNALKQDGTESEKRSRQLRKMAYEIIESKVDNSIPAPKMQPRYKSDLPLVNITENYLKFNANRILTKYNNDKSERATYVDGTGWYKVGWDSLSSSHERSGDLRIDFFTVDKIIPQPGVNDYKQLEYIFELNSVSTSKIYQLYNKVIESTSGNGLVDIVSCYYLNDNGIVGLFMWAENTRQVICNEEDWQIRKLRKCKTCAETVPQSDMCPICGSKKFSFVNAEIDILDEDLYEIYNPYEVGETDNPQLRDKYESRIFIEKGTEIPFYHVRQLPFVPRPAISSVDSIYGISEVKIILEMQDAINKVYSKAVDKTLKSGAVVTKPEKLKINDNDGSFKIIGVRSAEEAQMVNTKQIMADTSQDIMIAATLYDSGKASSGVTASFQGVRDTTATSGKAKQFSAMQTAGRIESLRVMKSAAFAGLYELAFKYLLAFSDESRKFTRVLPNGTEVEEIWNKYMFLAKDKYGTIYYRDDFVFDTDAASTLSENRVQMWQETQDKFINGAFGVPNDPRTLTLFWNVMDSLQYPLSKVALAGIKETEQHLPPEVEQALMQNPQLLQMVMNSLTENRGGARPNSGPDGNGATHAANVERTNNRNRSQNRNDAFSAQSQSAQMTGGGL
jgi:hypothetical protein